MHATYPKLQNALAVVLAFFVNAPAIAYQEAVKPWTASVSSAEIGCSVVAGQFKRPDGNGGWEPIAFTVALKDASCPKFRDYGAIKAAYGITDGRSQSPQSRGTKFIASKTTDESGAAWPNGEASPGTWDRGIARMIENFGANGEFRRRGASDEGFPCEVQAFCTDQMHRIKYPADPVCNLGIQYFDREHPNKPIPADGKSQSGDLSGAEIEIHGGSMSSWGTGWDNKRGMWSRIDIDPVSGFPSYFQTDATGYGKEPGKTPGTCRLSQQIM